MKNNIEMIRKMGDFDVVQRSKDGMFNATALLKQWNNKSGKVKKVGHFSDIDSTEVLIKSLIDRGICKGRDTVLIKKRGKNGGTWMCPYLFLDFAMWLNVDFKIDVLAFISDKLILFRNQAGDNWKPLCVAFNTLGSSNYIELAKALNFVIFNRHHKDIRNTATMKQISDMTALQLKYTDLINEGYIRSQDKLMEALRGEWRKRHAVIPRVLYFKDK